MQDPQTKQILRIDHKVGLLFKLVPLQFPLLTCHHIVVAVVSFKIWHSLLGHISSSKLTTLIYNGHLSSTKHIAIGCLPCQLAKQHMLSFLNSISIFPEPF